jgi:hypothetical protein
LGGNALYGIENMQFRDPQRAILGILYQLLNSPEKTAVIKVADEDAANLMNGFIQDAVDRIKIEFDSSENGGANPIITPSRLFAAGGVVDLGGAYDQILHAKGFEDRK